MEARGGEGSGTAFRLLAYIKRKEGATIRCICAGIGRPYGTGGTCCLLHGLGFSCRRPRLRHPKSAPESEKKGRLKKS